MAIGIFREFQKKTKNLVVNSLFVKNSNLREILKNAVNLSEKEKEN